MSSIIPTNLTCSNYKGMEEGEGRGGEGRGGEGRGGEGRRGEGGSGEGRGDISMCVVSQQCTL